MADTKQQLQEAQGFLRTAERNMFSGKNQEAVDFLNKADALYIELQKVNPDDFQVKSLFSKIEKMRKDLEKKGVKTREGGNEELPFEVNAQLQRIKESVINKNLDYAKREMDNFYSRFAGPYTDLPVVKELNSLIVAMENEAQEKQKQQEAEKAVNARKQVEHEQLCEQWRQRFREVGYFDGTPHNVFDLSAHMSACRKAVELVNEYMRVDFSLEPDVTLQSMVEDVKRRVESFIPNYMNTTNEMAAQITERIGQHIQQLQNDKDWKNDETKMPGFTGQAEMTSILSSIEEMRDVCAENMQAFNDMMHAYNDLHQLNEERKEARASRTRMKPEMMDAAEGTPLKECAIEALKQKKTGVEILKTVVVKAWETKFEEGWEDNTKSKWLKRNYRESAVQIAGKLSTGDVRLFSMYVEQTLSPDNSWVNTRSHLMFDEAIKEENL